MYNKLKTKYIFSKAINEEKFEQSEKPKRGKKQQTKIELQTVSSWRFKGTISSVSSKGQNSTSRSQVDSKSHPIGGFLKEGFRKRVLEKIKFFRSNDVLQKPNVTLVPLEKEAKAGKYHIQPRFILLPTKKEMQRLIILAVKYTNSDQFDTLDFEEKFQRIFSREAKQKFKAVSAFKRTTAPKKFALARIKQFKLKLTQKKIAASRSKSRSKTKKSKKSKKLSKLRKKLF